MSVMINTDLYRTLHRLGVEEDEAQKASAAEGGSDPELPSFKGDVASLKGDVATLKGDVSTLRGDVSTLKGDVSTLKSHVEALRVGEAGMRVEIRIGLAVLLIIAGKLLFFMPS